MRQAHRYEDGNQLKVQYRSRPIVRQHTAGTACPESWNSNNAHENRQAQKMMDQQQPSSSPSKLNSISSASSPPSLSGSIVDSDAQAEPSGPQDIADVISTSRPQRPSPFKSFRSLNSTRPFQPLRSGQFRVIVTAISFASAAAVATASKQHRTLEDEEDWTGQWNGEWQAADDATYAKNGDDDDGAAASSGMWLDNDDDELTPEKIITYVSIGILSFMTLLCCVCYPEILVVGYAKMCGCCGLPGATKDAAAGDHADGEHMGTDYAGGAQDETRKKKRRKSKTRSNSKSRDKTVELV
mmetsp:Transcript_14099/g.34123  ORF Transcript_14099/g.34123 Transcript_14099/m.34123 type:complete len:298 (+) Transcript_14099:32-925(+)